MIKIIFARRSRRYPGQWLKPETAVLSREGAERFVADANASPDWHIISVRACA